MRTSSSTAGESQRYGIGEWYGLSFVNLPPERRTEFAEMQLLPKAQRPVMPCLPRGGRVPCTKEGGVCSLRAYQASRETGFANLAEGASGTLVTTCPARFAEGGIVVQWIGEQVLGNPQPLVIGEVGFLERDASQLADPGPSGPREDVGRIDSVLVDPTPETLKWCALEVQAVYFSGDSMMREFRALATQEGAGLNLPVGRRRLDYRSSGPKRLMPQLQIKVPTLRRWGKKMAVVIDESFFAALGSMDTVSHISNSDIAWFVVGYDESAAQARLCPRQVHLTTLERAVEGLTAGHPVSLEVFEARIRAKLSTSSRSLPSSPGLG